MVHSDTPAWFRHQHTDPPEKRSVGLGGSVRARLQDVSGGSRNRHNHLRPSLLHLEGNHQGVGFRQDGIVLLSWQGTVGGLARRDSNLRSGSKDNDCGPSPGAQRGADQQANHNKRTGKTAEQEHASDKVTRADADYFAPDAGLFQGCLFSISSVV